MGYPDTSTVIVVREIYNDDNDPIGGTEHPLRGCRVAARLPKADNSDTGERVVAAVDVYHPDRGVDVRGTDRARLPGDSATGRARWTVEGEPARSPWPDGGCVFVLQREHG